LARDAGLNHCLPGAARRKCRQLRKNCHGLAFERRASVEVARQPRGDAGRQLLRPRKKSTTKWRRRDFRNGRGRNRA
jgi:hypothetical protein